MTTKLDEINFNSAKKTGFDFDILTLESILKRKITSHDQKKLHRVQFYLMLIVTSGQGKHTIDFNDYTYSSGSVLTIRKNQIHSFHDSEAKGYLLLFTEEYVVSFLDQRSSNKIAEFFNELLFKQHSCLDKTSFKESLIIISQIKKEFTQDLDDHTPSVIRNFLQILISKIYRIRENTAQKQIAHKYTASFVAFQQLVESNSHKTRNVAYYAEQLNITARTLNNITHATNAKSAKAIIDDITILKIKRLLINTSLSIKEIAYQSGFNEPTNLFKYFKKYTTLTPEQFRSTTLHTQ